MKKAVLDKLAAALESAGFEIISLTEETNRHIYLEKGGSAFNSNTNFPKLDNEATGAIQIELKAL
jgi:hypothetical protein